MKLFILSLFIIFCSSYLLTSISMKNNSKSNLGFLFFNLIGFAQLVLSFEILSLFNLISEKSFIGLNIIFLLISSLLFVVKKCPIYKPKIKNEVIQIKKALKRDKLLFFISICFLIFILCTFLSAVFVPVTFGDALIYYLTRCTSWIQNGNINHFITPDAREIIMPVNMDFLYTYVLMFRKNENGVALFSFIAFSMLLYVIYHFLGSLGFSRRKRLWSVFVVASFSLIGIMAQVPCSDIMSGTLLLVSVYLVFCYLQEKRLLNLFYASFASALSFGVKTTSFIAFPSVILLIIIMLYLFKKEEIKKTLVLFLIMLSANFIVFSAYNYILNFLHFNNPISSHQFIIPNEFAGGIKGFCNNVIKNILMFFDASGLTYAQKYNDFMNKVSNSINIGTYTNLFPEKFVFNSNIKVAYSGLGILGLVLFVPAIFISLLNILNYKKIKSKKVIFISAFGLIFIFNFILFSALMVYTAYNMRYFVTFICISSLCLVFTYIKSAKRILKWVLCYFMFTYLVIVGHKPITSLLFKYIYLKTNTPEIHNTYEFINHIAHFNEENVLTDYLKKQSGKNIGMIAYANGRHLYDLEKLKLQGYKIDKLLVANINDYDLSKYDFLITNVYKIDSDVDMKLNNINEKPPYNCKYIDKNLKETTNFEKSYVTVCDIPFDYLSDLGFRILEDIKTDNYYLWENTK